MKKHIFILMVAVIMFSLFGVVSANAETSKYGDYLYYQINSDNTAVTINACDQSATQITIPDTIEGLPVTRIGVKAFMECYNLTRVTIPDSVTNIGNGAFRACVSIKRIIIPDSVTDIGSMAFYECSGLIRITIGNNVTSIEERAFYGCSNLVSVNIPASVTSIGNYAFTRCSSLENVTIPASVISIGEYAFYNCESLTSITIPNSITSIGNYAFQGCRGLTSVHISDIASWCNIDFADATSNPLSQTNNLYLNGELITDLVIPDGVTSIPLRAFYNCESLTSITIPESVTSVGKEAFSGCRNINSVHISDVAAWCNFDFYDCTQNPLYYAHDLYLNDELIEFLFIPDGVTSIGKYAFYNCNNLIGISIPQSVTSVGRDAFSGCSNLVRVNIFDIASWCNIDFVYGTSNPLLCAPNQYSYLYLNGELITDLVIPDGVTKIDNYAFNKCINLSSISIPNSVTSIGMRAFYHCESLTSITIPENVTSIGEEAFYNCLSLTSIKLPDSIERIKYGVFHGCDNLTHITIPESVTIVEETAFFGCKNLKDIYYSGTETQWNDIYVGYGNNAFNTARVHYNYIIINPNTYIISDIQPVKDSIELIVETNKNVSGMQIVIVAYYDKNGVFIGMQTRQITGSTQMQIVNFEFKDKNVATVKAFIWGSLNDMMPASHAVSLDL